MSRATPEAWTPARTFLLVSAVYHLPLGVGGLLYDQTFPIGAAEASTAGSVITFGLFETNGWHSLAALLLGVVSAYFALRPDRARAVALSIGGLHVFIVFGLIVWPPETFWLASNGPDQVIHTATAVGGLASGLMTRRTPRARAAT